MVEVPADRINLEFVLGNKVMVGTVNANREYFELGVRDMAQAEAEYPGWLARLLTHPVKGLENYRELLDTLTTARGAIKVFCEVADLGGEARGGRTMKAEAQAARGSAGHARRTGGGGDRISRSASGARCARTTRRTGPRGIPSRTTTRARGRIAGARTASSASRTITSGSASRSPCGTSATPS